MRPPTPRVTRLSFDGSAETLSLGTRKSESKEFPRSGRLLPDFFDLGVIKMAFSNKTTSQRLFQFAKSRNCAADMEFLMKVGHPTCGWRCATTVTHANWHNQVEEYGRAFDNMTSLISQISTNYTGITATSPLGLPIDLSNTLKVSTKHYARAVLPPLERLYRDAKDLVEERLAKGLYPDFVKFQLTQCMRSSMSVSRSLSGGFKSAYPGLGDAFGLTDPHRPGNPIVYASDGLLKLSGYERREMMGKNPRMLQCISTDTEVTRRIRESLALGRESVELVINRRKDGTPFWNLLFICPLYEQGSVRYHLGAQINVSASMGSDSKDILRVLNFALPDEEFPPTLATSLSTQDRPVLRASSWPQQERVTPDQPQDQRNPQHRSHYHRFFRHFKRKCKASTSCPPLSPQPIAPVATRPAVGAPSTKRRALTMRSPRFERRPDEYSTPYARFFVMRYNPPCAPHPNQSHNHSYTAGLPITFCSSSALQLLGVRSEHAHADTVHGLDIFTVLTEYAGSASVNRGFKSAVLDRIAAGDSLALDLMATNDSSSSIKSQTGKHSRNGGMMRAAAPAGVSAADRDVDTSSSSTSSTSRPRLSDTFDRGAEFLSHVFFGHKMRKLVTHWAPLKDADGQVAFVMLVLTPAAGA